MLFVLCSGSAFAQDINGYNVVTYYNVYDNGTGTAFLDTIETSSSPELLYVVVDVVVNVDKGDVFDIELSLTHGNADVVYLGRVEMINTDWEVIEEISGDFSGGSVTCDGITAPKNLKCIRFTFNVTNPEYYIPLFFTVNPNSSSDKNWTTVEYQYEDGMTFEQWVNSSYNTDGFVCCKSTNSLDTRTFVAIPLDDTYYRLIMGCAPGETSYKSVSPTDLILQDYTYKVSTNNSSVVPFAIGEPGCYDFSITSVTLDIVDEGGLLTGITDWVKKIWTSITELPTKIVNGITNGIKSLFIPTEESIQEIKAKFESLLAQRFGAAYEAGALVDDFVSAFTYENNKPTITFPEVTVNLVGTDFTFGGWNVDIIPKGLEMLLDALKLISNIVCTFLFVNALKKRFEGVVGS